MNSKKTYYDKMMSEPEMIMPMYEENKTSYENYMSMPEEMMTLPDDINHEMISKLPRDIQKNMESRSPASLLPNPGEGGPVYPGVPSVGEPMIPLPNPGEGGGIYPGIPSVGGPMIPLPNPGEGGPVAPIFPPTGGILPTIIGTIITTYPRPNETCKFCRPDSLRYGEVRMLNASCNYNPFKLYINEKLFSDKLGAGEVTEYEKVEAGEQTFSAMDDNGYVYLQKKIDVPRNKVLTIAIVETASGLDFYVIPDEGWTKNNTRGCIRVCNLSYNSGAINTVFGERYVSFYNVDFMETTDFKNIWPGNYDFYVMKNMIQPRQNLNDSNVLLSSTINIQKNTAYTLYIFNWKRERDAVRGLILADR